MNSSLFPSALPPCGLWFQEKSWRGKKKKQSINRHFIFCNISLPTSLSIQLLKGAKVLIWNTYSSKYFFFHETTLLGCNNPGFSRLQLGNTLLYFACAKNCGFGFFGFWGWGFGGFAGFFFIVLLWGLEGEGVESGLDRGIRHHRDRMNNCEHGSVHGVKVR